MAKFDFTAESNDELTLKVCVLEVEFCQNYLHCHHVFRYSCSFFPQVGDIITEMESVDEQWIVGVVDGKRGIVPKNYISGF